MRTVLLLYAAISASALPLHNMEAPPASEVVPERETLVQDAYMKPGMKMGAMHEPAGPIGLFECKLRGLDRVLRNNPKKYNNIRHAMTSFEMTMTKVKLPHVKSYLGCVIGEGELLPDCTMMAPVHNSDILTYLKQGGSDGLKKVEELSAKEEGFAKDLKTVQKVVCDAAVLAAVYGKKEAGMDMKGMDMKKKSTHSMKHMDMQKKSTHSMKHMDMKHMDMKHMDMKHMHSMKHMKHMEMKDMKDMHMPKHMSMENMDMKEDEKDDDGAAFVENSGMSAVAHVREMEAADRKRVQTMNEKIRKENVRKAATHEHKEEQTQEAEKKRVQAMSEKVQHEDAEEASTAPVPLYSDKPQAMSEKVQHEDAEEASTAPVPLYSDKPQAMSEKVQHEDAEETSTAPVPLYSDKPGAHLKKPEAKPEAEPEAKPEANPEEEEPVKMPEDKPEKTGYESMTEAHMETPIKEGDDCDDPTCASGATQSDEDAMPKTHTVIGSNLGCDDPTCSSSKDESVTEEELEDDDTTAEDDDAIAKEVDEAPYSPFSPKADRTIPEAHDEAGPKKDNLNQDVYDEVEETSEANLYDETDKPPLSEDSFDEFQLAYEGKLREDLGLP